MKTYRHIVHAAAALGALVVAHPVQAQEQVSASDSVGEAESTEIVVTARRREERLQDVAIAVTPIGGGARGPRGVDGGCVL